MTSRNVLYGANTSSQALAIGDVINFGSPVRRYGNRINMSGGNLVVNGGGYYDIMASVSFTGSAGTTSITLYDDGVAIPGAEVTISTAASTRYSVTIPAVIRNRCCESTVTAIVTGAAATVTDASIRAISV